jgi:hypothetical protein
LLARSGWHVVPGEHDHAVPPGFPEAAELAFEYHPAADRLDGPGDVGVGIDQDRDQAAVVIGLLVEQQEAGLGGDRDLDLVGQSESATALEVLLGEEHVGVALKVPAVGLAQAGVEWDVLAEERLPLGREGLGAEPVSASSLEEPEHDRPPSR